MADKARCMYTSQALDMNNIAIKNNKFEIAIWPIRCYQSEDRIPYTQSLVQ